MVGTRDRVLSFILRQREVRVEELAQALEITPAAVRRHLDHLRADGLVDVRVVRQATGRPFYAYTPTELALGQMPEAYAGLMERMLRSLEEGGPVSERMAESVAAKHRAEVWASEPADLVAQVTESLRSEGILDGWQAQEDGFHLVNGACPYRRAAEISHLPCESDRQTIALLLGAEVDQTDRIVDGAPRCEYVVRRFKQDQPVPVH